MSKNIGVFFTCIIFVAVFTGCSNYYYSEGEYFGGAAYVEYRQNIPGRETDSLMIRFYEPGLYAVIFSEVRGRLTNVEMPKSFIKKVDEVPTEVVFNQRMPGFVTITIVTGNNDVESREFH